MAEIANDNRYKDLDLDFIAHPTSGDIVSKVGVDAIKRSVRNLIYMRKYEKPFQPDIHSKIRSLLFEPSTPLVKIKLKESISDVLLKYEPRINVTNVSVVARPDDHVYMITVVYQVKNQPELQTVSVQMERLR
jgi:hypothetical protein